MHSIIRQTIFGKFFLIYGWVKTNGNCQNISTNKRVLEIIVFLVNLLKIMNYCDGKDFSMIAVG